MKVNIFLCVFVNVLFTNAGLPFSLFYFSSALKNIFCFVFSIIDVWEITILYLNQLFALIDFFLFNGVSLCFGLVWTPVCELLGAPSVDRFEMG